MPVLLLVNRLKGFLFYFPRIFAASLTHKGPVTNIIIRVEGEGVVVGGG